jgi:poly(3-hydroxyalkanoate) synthetase
MILGQAQTTTFKLNLLQGLVNFNTGSPYTYKIALYNAVSTINSETTAYTTQDEITGIGYVAGGKVLAPTIGSDPSNNTAYVTFANVTWSPANFTAAGALIYNSTTNASVAVLNFGGEKVATTTFTIEFPAATSTTAVLRIN